MNETGHENKPPRKTLLGVLLGRAKDGTTAPTFIRVAPVPPPGGRHRDPRPVTRLAVVGLLIILLIGYVFWKYVEHKNKPHVPPKNMPMIHLRSGE